MVKIFVSGIFPRDDNLIKKINRFEQGKENLENLKKTYEENENFWIDLQKGLDFISEPSLSWHDVFRPFTLNLKNIEPGPLTRYLETNTFFRIPVVKGYPEKSGSLLDWKNEYGLPFIFKKDIKIILPGPFSFLIASEFKENIDKEKYFKIIQELIFDEAKKFNFVEFREPFVKTISDLENIKELYSVCDCKGYVFTNIKSEKFIDFPLPYALESNEIDTNENIIFKLIDVFTTRIESLIINKDIQITTTESLDFLPFEIAKKKIEYIKKLKEVK